jgi:hypothetical protein
MILIKENYYLDSAEGRTRTATGLAARGIKSSTILTGGKNEIRDQFHLLIIFLVTLSPITAHAGSCAAEASVAASRSGASLEETKNFIISKLKDNTVDFLIECRDSGGRNFTSHNKSIRKEATFTNCSFSTKIEFTYFDAWHQPLPGRAVSQKAMANHIFLEKHGARLVRKQN